MRSPFGFSRNGGAQALDAGIGFGLCEALDAIGRADGVRSANAGLAWAF